MDRLLIKYQALVSQKKNPEKLSPAEVVISALRVKIAPAALYLSINASIVSPVSW